MNNIKLMEESNKQIEHRSQHNTTEQNGYNIVLVLSISV